MRVKTRASSALRRLKYGTLRMLGVVSPSGRYPMPPRWALSKIGRHRFYDAPECAETCCPWNSPPARCLLSCCAPSSDTVGPVAAGAVNGRERGDSAC
ncbi:hypothetical protein SEA_MAIH_20 [Streptomyces phage Maih]|uniref:Uncharacterized protein n=5 Tax=Woodruffvirus TP1604 TaxID=1982746 RepID=A0A1P8VVX7_9CAUD|nr:hypothetical protein AVT62_gp20 [Streptomyces phage TP1604]ALY07270.1 hypothetical protein SEA_MAIH_20 [Streptomyces phage Maih]APZ82188.1 hypothetical protein SEA_BABYGOTBAC_20 [Streptomyces phage BabyGotBac]AWN08380.1 hypothetical protein SEA_BAYC_20 [Streptomyces phage BayC]AWN08451.1 hypothetical protein SEA_SALETE_20 [Streptomyces phage Salete]USH45395.1 hypothetical protein SEA_ASIS_20 [Streptomyces phage Asis]